MSEDRRTKAQLIREIEDVRGELENTRAQNAKLQQLVEKPVAVPEADALAGCIRSLDRIAEKRQAGYGYGSDVRGSLGVEMVVRHLIGRYGLALVERSVEPCGRKHLDEASDPELIERLRGVWIPR